jgi:hypothetical protein
MKRYVSFIGVQQSLLSYTDTFVIIALLSIKLNGPLSYYWEAEFLHILQAFS